MAISLKLPAPPTDEEILEISERNPGFQFERSADGELLVTPGSSETARREAAVVIQLGRWAETHSPGVVFSSSAGFHLPDGSLLSPDAAWMPKERWMALTPKQRDSFAPLCPDAVFEIASKTDTRRALRAKMRTYVANGSRLARGRDLRAGRGPAGLGGGGDGFAGSGSCGLHPRSQADFRLSLFSFDYSPRR